MSIKSKQDIINLFCVHRNTFNKTVLPKLLEYLGWDYEKYKAIHKSHFDIETASKITEFVRIYQDIL